MSKYHSIHRWTTADVAKLLKVAAQQTGRSGSFDARRFWRAWLLLVMDTGERSATLLALRPEWVDWEIGAVRIPGESRKMVGSPEVVHRLQAETLAALRMIFDSQRQVVFNVSRPALYRKLGQLVAAARIGGGA